MQIFIQDRLNLFRILFSFFYKIQLTIYYFPLAVKNKLKWAEAVSNVNLSDPYAKKGKTKRSRQMLRAAKKYFELINDDECVSDVNFNIALVCIEEGNRDLALYYFSRCEDFPLQYKTA